MTHSFPPLWKQLLGASAGAFIALGLYGIYDGVVPHFEAYLVPRETLSKETVSNQRHVLPQTQERFDRIAEKTRAMVEEFDNQQSLRALEEGLMQASSQDPEVMKPVSSSPTIEESEVSVTPEPIPVVANVPETIEEQTPILPQSGAAMSLGILAACAGGMLSLRHQKKRT